MDWVEALYSDAIPWLLERSDPSVRYWTLTRLLDRPLHEEEVVEAQAAIMLSGPVAEILAHYAGDGRWEGERSHYTPKYRSTHWQLLLLAELGATGRDERIAAACTRMVEELWEEDRSAVYPCFYGNLIGYLHALGHGRDERVREFEAELARTGTRGRWRCRINGDLPCAWGAARALWGLSRIPPALRSPEVQKAIDAGVRFLARYKLHEGAYPTATQPHRMWTSLNFPLFYQVDVLFVLRVLTDLGRSDHPRFRRALGWLEERRRDDFRWNGANPFKRRMWAPLEETMRPSKWVTWQALYVLKAAHL